MKKNGFSRLIAFGCLVLIAAIIVVLCLIIRKETSKEIFLQPEGEKITIEEVCVSLYAFDMGNYDFYEENLHKDYLTYQAFRELMQVLLGENNTESIFEKYKNRYSEEAFITREDYIAEYANILRNLKKDESVIRESFFVLATKKEINGELSGFGITDMEYVTNQGVIQIYPHAYQRESEGRDYLFHSIEGYVKDGTVYWVLGVSDSEYVFHNAFLLEPTEGLFFYEGLYYQYPKDSFTGFEREQVFDLKIAAGEILQVDAKADKISGKVLSVGESYVELEGYGKLMFHQEYKIYDLCNELGGTETDGIAIGYDFCDFVMDKDQICAVLIARTGEMDHIRVLLRGSNLEGRYYETLSVISDAQMTVHQLSDDTDYILEAGQTKVFDSNDYSAGDRILLKTSVLTQKTRFLEVLRNQGNAMYRGDFELYATEDGFIVINELALEEYLYAVVPSEMPSSYPKESLKAQAICARTYAYMNIVKAGYPKYGAHVDDSAAYQVYQNISENVNTTQAVKDTDGEMLYFEGKPAQTYYYSTSAGFGNSVEVWNGKKQEDFPYMTSVHYGSCESVYTPEALQDNAVYDEYIRQKDENDFEVNEGWYRWTYTVEAVNSSIMEEKLKARYEMNPKLVLTRNDEGEFVSEPVEELGELENLEIVKRLPGGNAQELIITGSKHTFKVVSELYIRAILCDGETKVVRQTNDSVAMPTLLPSGFISLEIEKNENSVVKYKIYGGGFGHGVGMSQNGAKAMAKLGYDTEAILAFFYPGTEIVCTSTPISK